MKYYSPSAKAFYDDELNYPSLPNDIISLTDAEHINLVHAVNTSKDIVVVNGVITLVDKTYNITWNDVRKRRSHRLKQSDYTQLPDWTGNKEAWATYRQQLRDITETYDDPNDVIWPTAPGE
jgi:hypothetical protein